jgi:hypothetical protein
MTSLSRRSIITGLVSLVAAPAIVRAGSLMPVSSGLIPGPEPDYRITLVYAEINETCGRVPLARSGAACCRAGSSIP